MNEKKRRLLVFGILFFIIAGILLGSYVAGYRADRHAKQRAEKVLMDSAVEQAKTFTFSLNGSFQILESISVITKGEYSEAEGIELLLDTIAENASMYFFSVDFIYPDGRKATWDKQFDVSVADREYFIQAMQGKRAMERIIGKLTGRQAVALAVPCYGENGIVGVLRGLFYSENLQSLINSQAYSGSGYSFLLCSEGYIIVNTQTHTEYFDESNIFDILAEAEFHSGYSLESFQEQLMRGEAATIHYDYGNISRVAVFTPLSGNLLPENDWFVYNVVYESTLSSDIYESRRDSLEPMFIFFTFAAVALALFILLERDYRKNLHWEAELARQREEQFRIVTQQSEKFVMRYDIAGKTLYRNEVSTVKESFEALDELKDPAREVVRLGFIDPSGAEDFMELFERIARGESPITMDIPMICPGVGRRWFRFVSTTIFDAKSHVPLNAVISYYDITDQREREMAYQRWQVELKSLPLERMALYEWNLTKDVSEGQGGSLSINYNNTDVTTFNARTDYLIAKRVFEEDAMLFASLMNREHLLGMFQSGKYKDSVEYRYIEDDNTLRWRRISVQLVGYPDSSDVKAYVTNEDIDDEKKEKLAAMTARQQDYLTGALNRETFIKRVSEILKNQSDSNHALFMLDLDGFKQINDKLGHDVGDKILKDFVEGIRSVLRGSDVVGRIGGDEFMAFLPDIPNDTVIERKADQLCSALYRRLDNDVIVSASIGIAVYPKNGRDFESLYRNSDDAMYQAKNLGKNKYFFYDAIAHGAGEENAEE